MSLKRKIISILLVSLLGVMFVASAVVAYAYFSKKEIYDGFISGQVELLFDRLDDTGITNYQNALNAEATANGTTATTASKDATWGTEAYPYVISNVRHLYNLSELQRLGYFDKKFISKNKDENGNFTSYDNIPYFLVCTPEYQPALIDGTNFKGITAIGTDKYPFIGSVKGVTSIATETTPAETVSVNGKACDTSAITNVKVTGNPNNPDVGLFGVIGFLGTEPEITLDTPSPAFEGQVSTVSNLVLSDVQITVDYNAWDKVTSFLEDIMINAASGHEYSYSILHGTDDYQKVPHENHHIGILAGHASYAKIEFISVYYSDDNIVAIDLTDKTEVNGVSANYFSSTGILGYLDNINPEITINADGTTTITAGSGDSTNGLNYGSVGGGGLASGNKAGYVLASEMYNKFCYVGPTDESGKPTQGNNGTLGTIYIKDGTDKDGNLLCTEWIRDRLLWGTKATGRYYFYDGVFTFALSDQEDVIEPTWKIKTDENGSPVLVDGNYDYDIPDFSIGQNDDDKWKVNTEKGNSAVVAYVKKATSNADVIDAIKKGKQIFIMQEGQENLFLMSLYNQPEAGSGNFNQKYFTNGTTQKFADSDLVTSLVTAYRNNEIPTLPDGTIDYKSTDQLANDLENGTLKAINVGITSSSVSLKDLKAQYKINSATTGNYKYFSDTTPVTLNNDGTIQQYYDYANSDYEGYFYYTTQRVLSGTQYSYYWQPINGDVVLLAENKRTAPNQYFTAQQDGGNPIRWEGERIYSSNNHTGVVVNLTDNVFYNSGNTANASGATLTKPITNPETDIYYFWCDDTVLEGNPTYTYSRDNTKYTEKPTETAEKTPSGKPIYRSADGKKGVLVERYPTYTFSNGDNYLRMIAASFPLYGMRYALWNGNNDAAGTKSNFTHTFTAFSLTPSTVNNSTEATLRFDTDVNSEHYGTCYIQYTIGNTSLFVNSTGSLFDTATSNTTTGTRLCIYTVEGTQDIAYGRITYDPVDDTASDTDCYTFNAGKYVLKADAAEGTTEYEVISLADLSWNNGLGNTLSKDDLTGKFKMVKGITFGWSFNLFNGTLGSRGIITAPVGTDGVEANIPQACVAFKINKAVENAKIRVILSVATSEFFPAAGTEAAEEGYDLGDYTRYFNLWKMEAAGESIVQVFQADDYLERFMVPRSHPYNPKGSISEAESITVKYKYDGTNYADYRCYLNGDRVLIAHEFVIDTTDAGTGIGVYCLGMSGVDTKGKKVDNVPMEIVYFSADGVASAGRDGATGSQIGTIDFVYDYQGNIVTVKESSSTDNDGNEDYNTYYPSYCLLYFNNSQQTEQSTDTDLQFVSINNEVVTVRRYVADTANSDANHNDTQSLSTLTFSVEGDKYVLIVQYSRVADNVREKGVRLE